MPLWASLRWKTCGDGQRNPHATTAMGMRWPGRGCMSSWDLGVIGSSDMVAPARDDHESGRIPSAKCDAAQELNEVKEAIRMYFMKTGSPAHLQWLRIFEPLMIITGIVQPLATLPSISKLYFTHSQHASGQSLTTWSIFAVASLLWVTYGLLNRKPAIYAGNIIGLVMNLLMVNGILMNAGWTY